MKFGTLWVGSPLSKLEQTALSSFAYYGHEITLFVYDQDMVVPDGVIKEDANNIIQESGIFKAPNGFASFADMFRYKMVQETGLSWTDTDNVCLRPDWDFPEYCFGSEDLQFVANGIIKAPKDSDFIKELVDTSQAYDKTKIVWSEIGPLLITDLINKYNLQQYVQPSETFYPIHWRDWKKLWSSEHTEEIIERSRNSHTLQFWNQMSTRENVDKNNPEPGSTLDYLYNKYRSK